MVYHGPLSEARRYSARVHSLGPIDVQTGEVPYPQLSEAVGVGIGGPSCQPSPVATRFPVDLRNYDVPSMRKIYESFKDLLLQAPAFESSFIITEGFPLQAVQALSENTAAYPHRSDRLLLMCLSCHPLLNETNLYVSPARLY